jgi:hypothetical protein
MQLRSYSMMLVLVALLLPDVARSEFPSVETTGSVRVRVLMPDGTPAEKAYVFASIWTDEKDFDSNQHYETAVDGWVKVRLPKHVEILRLWARKKACVPLFLNWDVDELMNESRDFRIPAQFEFKLPTGTKMSGAVRNSDGDPIASAEVAVRRSSKGEQRIGVPIIGTWLASGTGGADPHSPLTTDENGRWKLDNVPAGVDTQVRVKLRHSDYVDDRVWGGLQNDQGISMDEFRDGSAVIVMSRGVRLLGLVVDAATGKPVKDAVVVRGDYPYMETGSQEVRTNEKGLYELPPLPFGKLRVTAIAPGYAPAMKEIEISGELARRRLRLDASFRLKPGHRVRIRFTDDGRPVPGVYVGVDRWRGARSLYNNRHPNVINTKIPLRANSDGIYEWNWAPEDEVFFTFEKSGYEVESFEGLKGEPDGKARPGSYRLIPRDEPYEVELRKAA